MRKWFFEIRQGLSDIKWFLKTQWARFGKKEQRYFLSFPERFFPYNRRLIFDYFDYMKWNTDIFEYYYTFTLKEASDLKQKLEAQEGDAEFWDLKIYRAKLVCESTMRYTL